MGNVNKGKNNRGTNNLKNKSSSSSNNTSSDSNNNNQNLGNIFSISDLLLGNLIYLTIPKFHVALIFAQKKGCVKIKTAEIKTAKIKTAWNLGIVSYLYHSGNIPLRKRVTNLITVDLWTSNIPHRGPSLFLLQFSCYLGVGSGEGDGDAAGGLVGDDNGGWRLLSQYHIQCGSGGSRLGIWGFIPSQ